MRLAFASLFLFAYSAIAAGPVDLSNDREGVSLYSSRGENKAVSKALNQIESSQILDAFNDTERELVSSKLCSFKVYEEFAEKLHRINPKFNQFEGAIFHLRQSNEIDDVVTKILLSSHNVSNTNLYLPKKREDLFLPKQRVVDGALKILEGFDRKLENNCLDEAYPMIYSDIMRLEPKLKSYHLEALFVEAFEKKIISYENYLNLEKARKNDLEKNQLTLSSYFRKIRTLRTQFPLRDPTEKSNFVTLKAEKLKVTRRQRLLEEYSDLQIMMMANVIKKLRERLESPKAEILIYDRQNGVETITLEPMERFRLAIKLLRKEMAQLSLNTYFAGRTPSYLDLMISSYEVGMIPASELEEVAGLEEIWNPKKTFWQKAQVWVRTLSSVATIAVPPPYGFIPALALVVIEMTAGKKDDNTNDPTVLF
jgi:hypothetical protein